jgi:mannose-6-phosphate isomerase
MTVPIKLPANQPPQFYRGGEAIAALRGTSTSDSGFGPEDWVASTTTLYGQPENGLTRLPDGRLLRDAVTADPTRWLGARHVAAFADSTALLVKLLDAGQRLPVHFHPPDSFARKHFDSHFGKTEAWIVVGTSGPDPRVYPGFRETVGQSVVGEWVREQDRDAMLGALNSVEVRAGDTVYIPAGLPHAIGEGVFVVELQQPTDFSLTLEWRDFLTDPRKAHLGIGFDTALQVLDTTARDPETLIKRTAELGAPTVDLLVEGASPFFRADRLRPAPALALDASFAVAVVLDGHGTLSTEHGGDLALSKGDTVVVPYAAGQTELSGDLTVIRCRPPEVRS